MIASLLVILNRDPFNGVFRLVVQFTYSLCIQCILYSPTSKQNVKSFELRFGKMVHVRKKLVLFEVFD